MSYLSTLYDDGTHGDEIAGDGIFTRDNLKTRASSGFYDKYTLPKEISIRIVAVDEDLNYCIADAPLMIYETACPDDPVMNQTTQVTYTCLQDALDEVLTMKHCFAEV